MNQVESITATEVADSARLLFLPKLFGARWMILGEGQVYAWMRRLCRGYTGGFWRFVDLSNGGGYLAPTGTGMLNLEYVGNGFEGLMTPDAAGIVATLFALSHLSIETHDERHVTGYHALRDFAVLYHPEAGVIAAAID